jgi:hypothetical protein
MVRYYHEDRFEMFAVHDLVLVADEGLLHGHVLYFKWHLSFSDMNDIVHADEK